MPLHLGVRRDDPGLLGLRRLCRIAGLPARKIKRNGRTCTRCRAMVPRLPHTMPISSTYRLTKTRLNYIRRGLGFARKRKIWVKPMKPDREGAGRKRKGNPAKPSVPVLGASFETNPVDDFKAIAPIIGVNAFEVRRRTRDLVRLDHDQGNRHVVVHRQPRDFLEPEGTSVSATAILGGSNQAPPGTIQRPGIASIANVVGNRAHGVMDPRTRERFGEK
jgi:hypothetical protein